MIADEWQKYLRLVVPHGAPDVQVQETRRSFYAGASACLDTILSFLEGGEDPTELELGRMDALQEELIEFARRAGSPDESRADTEVPS